MRLGGGTVRRKVSRDTFVISVALIESREVKFMGKKLVGRVKHFFDKIGVAVIELSDTLNEGDPISIEGSVTNIQQPASSIQIDRKPVESAHKGQSVGLKIEGKAREGDKVFRIEE